MKKIFSIFLLGGILLSNAQQATTLIVNDTRSSNELPSFYSKEFKAEFKARNAVGVPGDGFYSGMLTIAPWTDSSGNKIHQLNFNDGGVYYRNAFQSSQWGGWQRLIIENDQGNVVVNGKLEAREIKVTQSPTADFVFEEDYALPTLEEVEKHIKAKKHLPEIASAKEMEKDGVNVGEFQIKLLQKIEELTLYSIEQNKKIRQLESENQQIRSLLDRVEKLETQSKN